MTIIKNKTTCPVCNAEVTDPRHSHPHNFNGPVIDMFAGKACIACNKPHTVPSGTYEMKINGVAGIAFTKT